MAKARRKSTPSVSVSAKLRKALSEFVAGHEQIGRTMAAAVAGASTKGLHTILPPLFESPGQMIEVEDETAAPRQRQSGKSLIKGEVLRRADAGERWDSITAASANLREWMETVSDRPLKQRSIENCLRVGDLWSLLSKK